MAAATESEAALGRTGWRGCRKFGLQRGAQPAEPLPAPGAGTRVWGRAGRRSFVLNFAPSAAGNAACQPHPTGLNEREGVDGFRRKFPWVGRTGKEGGGGEEEAHSQQSLRGQGCFGEGGRVQGLCAVRGHCQQQTVTPFAICRFPQWIPAWGLWITKVSKN